MGIHCYQTGCAGCYRAHCKCGQSCSTCRIAGTTSCGDAKCHYKIEYGGTNCRAKYVCFPCRHIIKTKYTYRMMYEDEDSTHAMRDRYAGARCNRCGSGRVILVGQTFRHCRSEAEWTKLEESVNKSHMSMHQRFTFCAHDRDATRAGLQQGKKLKHVWNDTRRKKNKSHIS